MTRPKIASLRPSPTPMVEPRRRGRPPANSAQPVEEERLLSLAFEHFAEQGYEATTVRELARLLGVSHNLLNIRFGKKQDLWKAAMDWRLANASRDVVLAFDESGTAEERLVDLVERFCRWTVGHSDIASVSYNEGRRKSWRLDYIVSRFVRPFQLRFEELMEAVRTERPVAAISTGALMALMVHGVGSFFALQPLHRQLVDDDAEQDLYDQAHAMARFLLSALLKEPDLQEPSEGPKPIDAGARLTADNGI